MIRRLVPLKGVLKKHTERKHESLKGPKEPLKEEVSFKALKDP